MPAEVKYKAVVQRGASGAGLTRRDVILGAAASAAMMSLPAQAASLKQEAPSNIRQGNKGGSPTKRDAFFVKDGTRLYFKDWGTGKPVVFSHGWPLSADAWDAQMFFLGQQGYRVIANDRRGHGRSGQSAAGNNIDTYADDLAQLMEMLNLEGVTLVGHSTGGGEVTRYVGRHGTKRLSKLVLISAIPPLRLKTRDNPDGAPIQAFDDLRSIVAADRSQLLRDLSMPFFGYNKPGAKPSEGVPDSLWRMGMQASILATFDGIKTQSETDFTSDLKRIDVPTLIIHGQEDQLVPVADSAILSAKLVKHSILKVYEGAPHGLIVTHAGRVNADLLAFLAS